MILLNVTPLTALDSGDEIDKYVTLAELCKLFSLEVNPSFS